MSEDRPSEQLAKTNDLLAEWAARSACASDSLIERFERMGYEVRGKSEDEITDVLRKPPTRAARGRSEDGERA